MKCGHFGRRPRQGMERGNIREMSDTFGFQTEGQSNNSKIWDGDFEFADLQGNRGADWSEKRKDCPLI